MAAHYDKQVRKKVALDEETYKRLKDYSRFNGLKLRMVIESFADLLEEDQSLSQRITEKTLIKQSIKS
ncbi:MAG: hypothetical protein RL563_2825 [Pseudomonadota bacterium]|jgi:hypothetical protein